MRDFKVRMPQDVAEATSANVTAWIDEALAGDVRLAADPGPGPAFVFLRLDPAKLMQLANKKKERVPVILRRVIATHVDLPVEKPEKPAGAAEHLPDRVLPRNLGYKTEDLLPIVKGMDGGLRFAYRRIYGLKELAPAETAEEDRELATAMAESINRRSPKWLLENADLAKLTVTFIRWTVAQTEQLDKSVEEAKGPTRKLAVVRPASEPAPTPATETQASEDVAAADEDEEPVQREGQF